jgi:hypothetical protein
MRHHYPIRVQHKHKQYQIQWLKQIAIYLHTKRAKSTLSTRPIRLALSRTLISLRCNNKTLQSIITVSRLSKMNNKTLVIVIQTYLGRKPKFADISRTRVSVNLETTVSLFTEKEKPSHQGLRAGCADYTRTRASVNLGTTVNLFTEKWNPN